MKKVETVFARCYLFRTLFHEMNVLRNCYDERLSVAFYP